jgi:hypothetical protein
MRSNLHHVLQIGSNLHLLTPCNDNADFCAFINPTQIYNIILVAGDALVSISVTVDLVLQ